MPLGLAPQEREVSLATLSEQFDEAAKLYGQHDQLPADGVRTEYPAGFHVGEQVIQYGKAGPHRAGDSTHESFALWEKGDLDSGIGLKRVTRADGTQTFSFREMSTKLDESDFGLRDFGEEDQPSLDAALDFLTTILTTMSAEDPSSLGRIQLARSEVMAAIEALQAKV